MKICAVYKITNTITGDFYIGSSKDVKRRWASHKWPSKWNKQPNNPMYIDMRKYGVDKFVFEILEEVEADNLKEAEQQFIETLKPTYNSNRANGLDIDKRKKYHKKYYKEYNKSDKFKEYQKEYHKTNKYKEYQKEFQKEYQKEYYSQLCFYNGETLTLGALRMRFKSQGIPHPTQEAKKYLIKR